MHYGGGYVFNRPSEATFDVMNGIRKLGVPVVDSWQPLNDILTQQGDAGLAKLYARGDKYFDNGCRMWGHMSAAGNQFTAELLIPVIKRELEKANKTTSKEK